MNHIWKEGKYVDAWTAVHVLAGLLLGWVLMRLFSASFAVAAMAVAVLVVYEGLEHLVNIHEHKTNRISDVVFGAAGVLLAYALFVLTAQSTRLAVILIAAAAFVMLEAWGWYAWFKRRESKRKGGRVV